MKKSDHISVCICTYKRPKLLEYLLIKLQNQLTDDLFTYSIVVVDNDQKQTAKEVVENFANTTNIQLDYYVEPIRNIALTRNRAVENARGNFIAFIDDDEFPDEDWLLNLMSTFTNFQTDGVLGPVRPHYMDETPKWLIKSRICERKSHKTGTVLKHSQTRTGNVLLKQNIFCDGKNKFGEAFGRTGGEDVEFFREVISKGDTFVWCNEAPVYEWVTPERWTRMFYIKKLLRIGSIFGEKKRNEGLVMIKYLLVDGVYIIILFFCLPLLMFFGQHIFMRFLIKLFYHIGRFLGCLGFVAIRERS